MNELQAFETVKDQHPDVIRGFIDALESTCVQMDEKMDIPIAHYFSKDLYAREMSLPQGALVVGKIHKHENLSIISKGEASVLSVEGVKRIKAPFTFVAPAGTKRVIFAHTDLVWTTCHATCEKDLDKIEMEIIAKDYSEVPGLDVFETYKIKEHKK